MLLVCGDIYWIKIIKNKLKSSRYPPKKIMPLKMSVDHLYDLIPIHSQPNILFIAINLKCGQT